MSDDFIDLTFNRASDGSKITVSATRDSIQYTRSGVLLSFHAYAGKTDEGDDLYLPYVLSNDNSSGKKSMLQKAIDKAIEGAIVLGKTGHGYIKGANLDDAIRKSPNAMRASGLAGAKTGFKHGFLLVAAKEIVSHVVGLDALNNRKHYYVTTDGPDLHGPIKLNV